MSRRADGLRGLDAAALAAMLADRAEALVGEFLPGGRREGAEWVALNPTRGDRSLGSFRIHLRGPKAGVWADFATGETGDALGLVAYIKFGGDRGAAIRWAATWLGVDGGQPAAGSRQRGSAQDLRSAARVGVVAGRRVEKNENRARALKLWRGSEERLKGTPAAAYLAGRGIDLAELKNGQGQARQPRALRFHRACWNRESNKLWPALLAAVLDPAGRFAAVHRTWLGFESLADGRVGVAAPVGEDYSVAKAPLTDPKMTLGLYYGSAIRLWRGASGRGLAEAEPGETVALTEGIEDALTVAIAKPELRVLAAVSLGNMANIVLPAAVECVLICADNDGGNKIARKAIQRAVAAFTSQGRKVLIARPPDGVHDFNDLLRAAEAGG